MCLYCICISRVLLQANTCTSLTFTCINYAYAHIYAYVSTHSIFTNVYNTHLNTYITYTYARLNICIYYYYICVLHE